MKVKMKKWKCKKMEIKYAIQKANKVRKRGKINFKKTRVRQQEKNILKNKKYLQLDNVL